MATCKNCGVPLQEGELFCSNCGANQTEQDASATILQQPDTEEAMPDTSYVNQLDTEEAAPRDSVEHTEVRTCPYCGKSVQAQDKFCMSCGKRLLPDAQSFYGNPVGSQPTYGSYASYGNFAPNQNFGQTGAPPYYSAYPNGYAPGVYGGMPQPVKKKRVWPIVLGVLVGVGLIFILSIYVILRIVWNSAFQDVDVVSAAEDYAYVLYTSYDSTSVLPEEFLAYLEDNYDVTEDELEDQLEEYLIAEIPLTDDVLMIPSVDGKEWVTDYYERSSAYFYCHDMKSETQALCEGVLSAYGIEADDFLIVTLEESDIETTEAFCMAQIGDAWYCVDALMMAEEVCQLNSRFSDQTASYMKAWADEDVETLHSMIPNAFWDYILEVYGISEIEADSILADYMEDSFGVGTISGISLTTDPTVWYNESGVEQWNSSYNYGFEYEFCADVDCTYDVTGSDGSVNGTYTVTHVSVEDQWYVLDVMADYENACYYAAYMYYYDGYDGYDGYDTYGENDDIELRVMTEDR